MKETIMILSNVVEVLIIYKYWFSLLKTRFSKKKAVIIYMLLNIPNNIKCFLMFEDVLLKVVTTYAFHIILLIVLFEDKIIKKVVVHMTYLLSVFVAEIVSLAFASLIHGSNAETVMQNAFSGYLWQITAYIFIFIFSTVGLILLRKKHINPDNLAVQYICLYAAIQFLIIAMLYAIMVETGVVSVSMLLVTAGMILISFAVSVVIYRVVKSSLYTKAEAEFLRKESEMKNAHFEKLKNQYMSYRRLRHDVYNHLRIIDEMDDTEKIRAYISDIKKEFDVIESEENTLNKCGED